MLKTQLIHPEILGALAAGGHGSKVHLTDSNYPAGTKIGENAELVYLNLAPGKISVTEVLQALLTAIPVESAAVMMTDLGKEAPIFSDFRAMLGDDVPFGTLERAEYYAAAAGPDTCLQIVTGEQRTYANILLTIGVVEPS